MLMVKIRLIYERSHVIQGGTCIYAELHEFRVRVGRIHVVRLMPMVAICEVMRRGVVRTTW